MKNGSACKFVNPTWKMISRTMNAKASSITSCVPICLLPWCILDSDSHLINGLNSHMMKKVGMGEFKPKSKGMENTTKDKWNMGKTRQVMNHAHALRPRNERMRPQ